MEDFEQKLKEVKEELQEVPRKMNVWTIVLRVLLVLYVTLLLIWATYAISTCVHSHPDTELYSRVQALEEKLDEYIEENE